MDPAPSHMRERTSRLLGALYREQFRSSAYRAYHRRARQEKLRRMLGTFLEAQARMIGLLEGHLRDLGVERAGRGALRSIIGVAGAAAGTLTSLRGADAILRRIQSEEGRGADYYGDEIDWKGWSEAEKQTLEGHACDQLYQKKWAGTVERDLRSGESD